MSNNVRYIPLEVESPVCRSDGYYTQNDPRKQYSQVSTFSMCYVSYERKITKIY